MVGLVRGRGRVVWTLQAQFAVTKRRIDEGAMMWVRRIVVLEGPEEATRHTHPGYGDATLRLKRTDHRDQRAQESRLLLDRSSPTASSRNPGQEAAAAASRAQSG